MSTISHDAVHGAREMWASLVITAMWVAVVVDALFGPDITTSDGAVIPSAVVLALFAWLGTRAVARYGFHRESDD